MAANQAPKVTTILVGLALTALGALGTFGDLFSNTIGVWLQVAGTAVILLGVFLRRL